MEQEHTPLWTDARIHDEVGLRLSKQAEWKAAIKVATMVRDDYETQLAAARREQAQRVETLEQERDAALISSRTADANLIDELQAEVARLKAQAWEPLEDGEHLTFSLENDGYIIRQSHSNIVLPHREIRLCRQVAQPTPPVPSLNIEVIAALKRIATELSNRGAFYADEYPQAFATFDAWVDEWLTAQEGARDGRDN